MELNLRTTNLDYVEEISGGDKDFKKELIEIFIKQIPEFLENMNKFLADNNFSELAKEAHTAKSSALIFRMEETGKLLKQIQLDAETNKTESIPEMIKTVQADLENASKELKSILKTL